MVMSEVARADSDFLFFNNDKVVLYHVITEEEDLTYGSTVSGYTTYTIPMQGNIMSWSDKFVRQGMLQEGDLSGVLRYEYTVDANGDVISPTLHPKEHDEISFGGRRFKIVKITPQISEDHAIILYTFEAKTVTTTGDMSFPLEFPIQF